MCATVTMLLSTVAGQNFITNGDMKIWHTNDSVPQGFQITGGTGTGLSHTYFGQEEGREGAGDYAIMCKRSETTGATGNYRLACPQMTFTQTGSYKLSFYLKGKGNISWIRLSTSATSAGTNNVLGVYPFDLADWTLHQYDFEITDISQSYYLLFMMNSVTDPGNPILFDDVSVTKSSAPSDITLKSIKFKDPLLNSSYPDGDFTMPGVDATTTSYTFPLWFGSDTVPTIIAETSSALATYTVNYGGSKKFSETDDPSVKTKIVTITVEGEDESTQDYTITFDRTDFVCGFISQISSGAGKEFSSLSTSLYRRNTTDHGSYWGNATVRPGSTTGGYLITTKLINGAGTLSFWTGKYSGSDAGELNIKVTYTTEGSIWNDVPNGLVRIDSAALNGAWTEFTLPIQQEDPNTQVKLEYVQGVSTTAFSTVNLDDIRITPYSGSSLPKIKGNGDDLNIFSRGQNIVIAEQLVYNVYAVGGQLIASGKNTAKEVTIPVKQGIYIVKAGSQAKKIIVK